MVTRLQHITDTIPLPLGPTEKQTLGMIFKRAFRQGKKTPYTNKKVGGKKKKKKQNQETTWPKIYRA